MAKEAAPFLMFEGAAEEAMRFYVDLFQNSRIDQITRYGANESGAEGSVKIANFTLAGQKFMCIDSPGKHDFTFTPSMSIFVECENEGELDAAFNALSEQGKTLMPPDNYGFSKKFCWINDRFGVSWQLNLAQ